MVSESPPDVLGERMARLEVRHQRRRVGVLLHQRLQRRPVHDFVDQHVGAFGELGERREIRGVAGEHDGLAAELEFQRIALDDRRMHVA